MLTATTPTTGHALSLADRAGRQSRYAYEATRQRFPLDVCLALAAEAAASYALLIAGTP